MKVRPFNLVASALGYIAVIKTNPDQIIMWLNLVFASINLIVAFDNQI